MKCGHVANATAAGNKPVCAMCIGLKPEAEQVELQVPMLTGRLAKCFQCGTSRPSDTSLPFFEHRATQEKDAFYCGCRGWD